MPCPHTSGDQSRRSAHSTGESSRREFLKAAVSIGGLSALTACLEKESAVAEAETQQYPQGPSNLDVLPDRQHEWVPYLVRNRFGTTSLPLHQTILLLDYSKEGTPTAGERERVEGSFRTLEHAYQRGTGGDNSAVHHEGLLFAVGYSPGYFDRFDDALPASAGLVTPSEVLAETGEETPEADSYDAVVHLASGYASVVLGAEEALFGELDRLNGVEVTDDLTGIFERAERRTGFVGKGQPAKRYEADHFPDESPLAMGFQSGFADSLPSEDLITIDSGPFAGGTTMQVSRLELDVDEWYENDRTDRTELMFSPEHSPESVGSVGENLAGDSGVTEESVEQIPEDVRERGRLGHSQKLAKARDEEFRARILRRDFDGTAEPSLHFDSWQRSIDDFVQTRKAMQADEFADELPSGENGILDYITVTNRATFLMPPRSIRALPTPRP